MSAEVDVETEVTVHWGCQLLHPDGSVYITRWDPGYGSGVYIPYTEEQARADVADHSDWPNKRLVTRTETIVTTTTPWEEAT